MEASHGHPFLRSGHLNTYTAYGIGSFAAWAVLLGIFFGWVTAAGPKGYPDN